MNPEQKEKHYRALENMYCSAPSSAGIYKPTINIAFEKSEVEIEVGEQYHHSAGGVHGSVYFKMLDDAAFFAANSIEFEYFVLTSSFTTYLTRPIAEGSMRSVGKVVNRSKSQIIAESVIYNGEGKELGRGSGVFVKGRVRLVDALGYDLELES